MASRTTARAEKGRLVPAPRRLLFRVGQGLAELVDLDELFFIEAEGGDTLVRTRRKRRYRSTERLTQIAARLPASFFSPHRSYLVNLDRVRQIRRRQPRGWELRLDPPVNAWIPVARSREKELFRRLEGGE